MVQAFNQALAQRTHGGLAVWPLLTILDHALLYFYLVRFVACQLISYATSKWFHMSNHGGKQKSYSYFRLWRLLWNDQSPNYASLVCYLGFWGKGNEFDSISSKKEHTTLAEKLIADIFAVPWCGVQKGPPCPSAWNSTVLRLWHDKNI